MLASFTDDKLGRTLGLGVLYEWGGMAKSNSKTADLILEAARAIVRDFGPDKLTFEAIRRLKRKPRQASQRSRPTRRRMPRSVAWSRLWRSITCLIWTGFG
jgi:hypothetical protein